MGLSKTFVAILTHLPRGVSNAVNGETLMLRPGLLELKHSSTCRTARINSRRSPASHFERNDHSLFGAQACWHSRIRN